MEWVANPEIWAALLTLTALEIVLVPVKLLARYAEGDSA